MLERDALPQRANRFIITCVRRVWYVIDTDTGARVSGGTYRRENAVADALERELRD